MRCIPARLLPCCLLVTALVAPAGAREVCDPSDAAFTGYVAVDLGAGRPDNALTGAPLGPGDIAYEFTSSGVAFRFESRSGVALATANGLQSWAFGGGAGIALTVSPAVSALGLRAYELDGCPGATYAGAAGGQLATAISCDGGPPCPATPANPTFFGAADIGAIGAADASRGGSVFVVTQLVFVPPGSVQPDEADLAVAKSEATLGGVVSNGEPIQYQVDVANQGPDAATDVLVFDFLPEGIFSSASHSGSGAASFDAANDLFSLLEPALAYQDVLVIDIDAAAPADQRVFGCGEQLVNVAFVSSPAIDPDLVNNLSIHALRFDAATVASVDEVCDDGIDNDCNGSTDCADSPCTCRPSLAPLPGGLGNPLCAGVIGSGLVTDERGDTRYCGPAPDHGCTVPRGACGGVTVPAACCDASLFSDPGAVLTLSACDVGVPGCTPRDPNFKESIPGVTLEGYGYTSAGRTMTYILHYENVGDADAHDVSVIDVLDEDLDDSTLVVHDGGSYDPATRTLVWTDPLVTPATPRQVGFEIDVRGDAEPGTRVRNVGTIVFPDAVPPTRIDTNFVEHVVPDPSVAIGPELSVLGCTETAPGSGVWRVDLGNAGNGFAYDVTARIADPPAAVAVSDGDAGFAHPDDPADGSFTTVIPAAITTSADTVAFETETPGDPCAALAWRIAWSDLAGGSFSAVVRESPDADADAVADASDNCPVDSNPGQADGDGDGAGDACDPLPPAEACDVDGDADVDSDDVDRIFAARGDPADAPDDPRDANRDGVISVNDARLCVLECTLPNCESPPPPACGLLSIEPLLLFCFARGRWRRMLAAGASRGGLR